MLRISKQPLQLQNSTHRAYLSMVLDTAWKNKCSTFLAPAVQMWQDHAAKQIDWFLYFQFFTSSTPSENNALKWFKGRLRQIQPWLAASLETTCNLFPAQASTFSLASAPWKAKLWGWRPDGMDAGAARLWTTRGKQRKRDNKTRHCTPLQSTILHMSSIRTKLLNYIQLFQLGTFPE